MTRRERQWKPGTPYPWKKGPKETVRAWWWCRSRICPECLVMVEVNWDNAPRPKTCIKCQPHLQREYMKRCDKKRRGCGKIRRKELNKKRHQREMAERKIKKLCSACNLRAVHKDLTFLCQYCYTHAVTLYGEC